MSEERVLNVFNVSGKYGHPSCAFVDRMVEVMRLAVSMPWRLMTTTRKIFAYVLWVEHRIWHHSKSSGFNLCRSGSEVHKFPTHAYQFLCHIRSPSYTYCAYNLWKIIHPEPE